MSAGGLGEERYVLAVCQFEPALFDKRTNLGRIADFAGFAARDGAKVVVFPECCLTGYTTGPEQSRLKDLAEPITAAGTGESVRALRALAESLSVYMFCGMPELVSDAVYNSCVLFFPTGASPRVFRKVHMWRAEANVFQVGALGSPERGPRGTIAAMICYDLEFPEAARSLALLGADVIAVSTANMEPWAEHQDVYVRARAMENNVHLALANCTGPIGNSRSVGASTIVDPYGHVLTRASTDEEVVLLAEIDLGKNRVARSETQYRERRCPSLYETLVEETPMTATSLP